jgi:hypothetical protein
VVSNTMDDLGELIEQLQALRNNAYMLYCPAVDEVLSGEVADINDITSVLDGLCDFCDEDRFLELYRKVCKHIYHKYPELVGEYVHLYRAIWMTNDDED